MNGDDGGRNAILLLLQRCRETFANRFSRVINSNEYHKIAIGTSGKPCAAAAAAISRDCVCALRTLQRGKNGGGPNVEAISLVYL